MVSSPMPTFEPRLLEAIDYPTDKHVLLERAAEIRAPDAVQDAIRRLPSGPFLSRDALVAAIERLTTVTGEGRERGAGD